MRLLLEHNLLNYNKLYVFARTLYQPQYQILRAGMENELSKQDIIQGNNIGKRTYYLTHV